MTISKKNIIFIIAGFFVLTALVLFVITKTRKTEQVQEGNTVESEIPSLPENQIAKSPNPDEIRKSVQEEFIAVQKESTKVSEKRYKDESDRLISLNDFSSANDIKIEAGVQESSSQKEYATYVCAKGAGQKPAIGIMLQQRRDVDPQKYQDMFSEMEKYMANWEKTVFNDLSPLFFSGESFQDTPNFGTVKYTTSNKTNIIQIHYANMKAVSGKTYSIDWGFLNDQVFISNDKNCLRKTLDENADAYEP